MSVGVWNENANVDEQAEMLKAVKLAQKRQELLNRLEGKGLGELVKKANSVTPPPAHRPVGGSRANRTKFPHRDTSVQNGLGGRNCRILFWDSDIRHIEYTPVKRYKLPETYVPGRIGTSYEEYTEMDPEWLITTFEGQKALDGRDALKVAYEMLGF